MGISVQLAYKSAIIYLLFGTKTEHTCHFFIILLTFLTTHPPNILLKIHDFSRFDNFFSIQNEHFDIV